MLDMRIILKSRSPLPQIKKYNAHRQGLFNVGGFELKLDNGQSAYVDWNDTKIHVERLEDDFLMLLACLSEEMSEEKYLELNDGRENLIPYDSIYQLRTWTKGTLTNIDYEAYERTYDDLIIPMDVALINLATVSENNIVLEDFNYSNDKLEDYNNSPTSKWRVEHANHSLNIRELLGA